MATKLNSTLKRELAIEGEPYMLAITPAGLKLTRKGRRKGHEIAWRDLVSGDAALAVALNASLAQSASSLKPGSPAPAREKKTKKGRKRKAPPQRS